MLFVLRITAAAFMQKLGTDRYIVRSNRESGGSRPDLVITEKKFMGRAIILELKISETRQNAKKH